MANPQMFISFDYGHHDELKLLLVGQPKNSNTPFELGGWSIKQPIDDNWKAQARKPIKAVEVVVVMCGEHTETTTGVSAELAIAQDEKVRYFLPHGGSGKTVKKPQGHGDGHDQRLDLG